MITELIPLEVGQSVCIEKSFYSSKEYYIDTVERFTKTQIVLKSGMRFSIDRQEHICKTERHKSVYYYLHELNQEMKEKIFRQNALRKIKEFNFSELSNEQLRMVVEVLKNDAS